MYVWISLEGKTLQDSLFFSIFEKLLKHQLFRLPDLVEYVSLHKIIEMSFSLKKIRGFQFQN
jgi:hypothetical protein